MSIPPTDVYLPLNEWIKHIEEISEHGKYTIDHFDQIPPHLFESFSDALLHLSTALEIKSLENRMRYRNIVVEAAPHLLPSFDSQFEQFF